MPITDFDSMFWGDGDVQEFSPNAKLLFIYTWTNSHKNVACLYHITMKTIQNETGLKNVPKLLEEIQDKILYDENEHLIWVVNHVRRTYLKHVNVSDKIVTAIEKNLLAAPQGHPFIYEFLNKYNTLDIGYPYPLREDYKLGIRLGKGLEKGKSFNYEPRTVKIFIPPTLDEVTEYCKERENKVDPQQWHDFYTSKGWKVGNQPMKDWKAAVRTWEKNKEKNNGGDKFIR